MVYILTSKPKFYLDHMQALESSRPQVLNFRDGTRIRLMFSITKLPGLRIPVWSWSAMRAPPHCSKYWGPNYYHRHQARPDHLKIASGRPDKHSHYTAFLRTWFILKSALDWINHFTTRVDYSWFLSFTQYTIKHDMDCTGNFAVKQALLTTHSYMTQQHSTQLLCEKKCRS